jgi:hypothetical protein
MSGFVEIQRVVIITDRAFEQRLLKDIVRLGAKGWTSTYCSGKGEHAIMEDPFAGPDRSRVRIEILASTQTAEAIMRTVEKPPSAHRREIFPTVARTGPPASAWRALVASFVGGFGQWK